MEFDIEKFAMAFGLPGLLIFVWYLLQNANNKRLEREFDARLKVEEKQGDAKIAVESKRLDVEEKKIAAMIAGFTALNQKIEEHTKVDLAHHASVREEIAGLSGRVEGIALERASTPVEGVPIQRSRVAAGTTYSIPRRRDEEK